MLDPAWPPERAAEVVRRLRPDLLVTDGSRPAVVAAARAGGIPVLVAGASGAAGARGTAGSARGAGPAGADGAPGGGGGSAGALGGESEAAFSGDGPGGAPGEEGAARVISGDRDGPGYASWLAAHLGADPAGELVGGADAGTFLIGFTSGTTGLPRAFRRSRASWRASLPRSCAVFDVDHRGRTLAPGPLAHGLGLYALAEVLHTGSAFATLPWYDVTAVADLLAAGEVTRLVVVPTMLRGLTRRLAELDAAHPEVATVVSSGSKLDAETLRRTRSHLPGAHVREYYGASELGFVTVRHTPPHAAPADAPDAVGTPFPGVRVEVRTPDGRPAPPGVPGTIHVRGDLACDGYVWGDDGTGFTRTGEWATVGDHGWLDAAGTLHLIGRAGGMVVTGGHNVHPGEVESALRRLDGVEDAVVVGVPDTYLGTALAAILTGPAVAAPHVTVAGEVAAHVDGAGHARRGGA
ncbi:hypothetical protein DEF28_21515, partial [Marinitenerispora sediminis]